MKKLLLLTFAIFTLSLKAQIRWADLEDSLTIFSEKNNDSIGYSPLFGAIALESNIIKNDWLQAHNENEKNGSTQNPLILTLFNYIEGDSSLRISRFNTHFLLSLTPLLIAKLIVTLEGNKDAWDNFKNNYGKIWRQKDIPSRFSRKADPIYHAYKKFCINDKNKQRAREYFSALLCLHATTKAEIQEYLMNIDTLNLIPTTSLQKINPDYKEYEKQTIELLNIDKIKNLKVPPLVLDDVSMCMEETIGTLINVLFYDSTNDRLTISTIPENIQKTVSPQLKDYIIRFPDPKSAYDQEKKEALISLFINIPEVNYFNTHESLKNNFEADTIPENLIFILNHLFGTKVTSFKEFLSLFNATYFYEKKDDSTFYRFIINTINMSIKLDTDHASFTLQNLNQNIIDQDDQDNQDDQGQQDDQDDEDDIINDSFLDEEYEDYNVNVEDKSNRISQEINSQTIHDIRLITEISDRIKSPYNPLILLFHSRKYVDLMIYSIMNNNKNNEKIVRLFIELLSNSIPQFNILRNHILYLLINHSYEVNFIEKFIQKYSISKTYFYHYLFLEQAMKNKYPIQFIEKLIKLSYSNSFQQINNALFYAINAHYPIDFIDSIIKGNYASLNHINEGMTSLDVIMQSKDNYPEKEGTLELLIQNGALTAYSLDFINTITDETISKNIHDLLENRTLIQEEDIKINTLLKILYKEDATKNKDQLIQLFFEKIIQYISVNDHKDLVSTLIKRFVNINNDLTINIVILKALLNNNYLESFITHFINAQKSFSITSEIVSDAIKMKYSEQLIILLIEHCTDLNKQIPKSRIPIDALENNYSLEFIQRLIDTYQLTVHGKFIDKMINKKLPEETIKRFILQKKKLLQNNFKKRNAHKITQLHQNR